MAEEMSKGWFGDIPSLNELIEGREGESEDIEEPGGEVAKKGRFL
jgi:hypothetical protein